MRESIAEPGKYLAMFADGRTRVIELSAGWSRIGRSRSADIRLDDPTVSRRHAVIVQTPEGELSVLDDRSMNGICVNGEPVDWSPLADGDELQIGRYTPERHRERGQERVRRHGLGRAVWAVRAVRAADRLQGVVERRVDGDRLLHRDRGEHLADE